MRFFALVFLLGLLISGSIFADIQTEVDKTSVTSDEIFTLTISIQDHLKMSPDLEPLKKDFFIMGTNQSSQFQMINGSTSMATQWQVALMPKHTGELQIPPLQVGNEKTTAQVIHVASLASNKPNNTANTDIFMEASFVPKDPFVQEQFLYTVKLYFSKSIENAYLMPPDLPDARISQSGQDIVYAVTKKGKYYRVLERSYAITPEKTGRLQISPPVLKGYLEGGSNVVDVYGLSNRSLKPIKIVGPLLDIQVKPKPANFVGHWLPAKKVGISQTWEPNPPIFREGEPVTRIVEVTAQGVAGDQIPSLTMTDTPNLNTYPQQPRRETQSNGSQQVGKLTQRIVYIPIKTGNLTLPPLKMRWWNSITKQEEVATLPAKVIKVLPPLTPTAPTRTQPSPANQPAPAALASPQEPPVKPPTSYFWPIVATIFIVLWLITIILWQKQTRSKKQPIQKSKTSELTPKKILAALKKACFRNDIQSARHYLLKWAAVHWKGQAVHSLADCVQVLEKENEQPLAAQIMMLEAIFYDNHRHRWDGMALWEAYYNYKTKKDKKQAEEASDPLPPLYCTDIADK